MNRFLPLITCLFVGTVATLVSSCARYVGSEPVLPPLTVPLASAGLAYESGSAGGLRYGPPVAASLGEEQYYGSYRPPEDQYYAPPGPHSAPLYGPPLGAR